MNNTAGISKRSNILFGIALVSIASVVGGFFLQPLCVELQISMFGEESEANILKVESFDADDGDRAWTLDYINYTFQIPDGFLFAGVNVANTSQTEGLIGKKGSTGNYGRARVEYVRQHPERHRLKGWGYDGLGPPGSIPSLLFRICLIIGTAGFACLYAYTLQKKAC
jgi:hypothetical protein